VVYKTIKKRLVADSGETEYDYTEPIKSQRPCDKKIPPNMIQHNKEHDCNKEHQCQVKCPECGSFCTNKFNHTDLHTTSQHRNKDHVYIISTQATDESKIIQDNKVRSYKVGDVFSGEHCADSCKRRGRSHFHLIECPGKEKCFENNLGKMVARHCTERYYPHLTQSYDKVLCGSFFRLFNWAPPVQDPNFMLCNAYCPHSSHSSSSYVFCTKSAWHTESLSIADHTWPSSCKHEAVFLGLDIAFVIDTTGSMGSYIPAAVSSIERIINSNKIRFTNMGVNDSSIRFAVVEYKDHSDNPVTSHINFTNSTNAIKFLKEKNASGGNDTPEAVFDGLRVACNFSWKTEHEKVLFLILDSPPHGKRYVSSGDDYPNGCPCCTDTGTPSPKTEEDIFYKLNNLKVNFKLVPLNSSLNKTVDEFKKEIKLFQSLDLTSAADLQMKLNDIVANILDSKENYGAVKRSI